MEKIVNSEIRQSTKMVNGRNKRIKMLFYLVKWKGYPEDECTWEPGHHLTSAEEKVEEFHQNNIRKIRVLGAAPFHAPGALDVRLQNSLVQTFICFVRR